MKPTDSIPSPARPGSAPPLTPAALSNLLTVTAPRGPIFVKGVASEVHVWTKSGDERPSKIYGRLVWGDSSIRFELPPQAGIADDAQVVLYGTLRINQSKAFRTTHEVILVGDVVGHWVPLDEASNEPVVALVRSAPRMPLEALVAAHGLSGLAFLATSTAWQDLTKAASSLPSLPRSRHVQTNFLQPGLFVKDLEMLCRDPSVKALIVARGGGEGIEAIGDSRQVAAALLNSGRPFYTALGHDKDVLLLDKHADQTFATPSILGQALVEAVRAWEEREHYRRIALENAQLKRQNDLPSAASAKAPSQGRVPIIVWLALLALVFLVGKYSR